MTHVVTGGTGGIGLALVRALAARGDRVVVVARDPIRGTAVCGDVSTRTGNRDVELIVADLSTLGGARTAADGILARCERLDALILNAGIWPAERRLTADGLEEAFGTNHLAPFVLAERLRERLVASRSRVVQVSAGLAVKGAVDLERTPTGEDFHALRTYANTKLWNLVTTLERARRWAGSGVTVNAVHPGVVATALGDRRGFVGSALRFAKRFWSTPEEGADAPLFLATDPALAEVSGGWFDRRTRAELPATVTDTALAARVWERTEALVSARS